MGHLFKAGPEFRKMLSGSARVDLVRIALEIAQDVSPEIDAEQYVEWIDLLVRRIRDRCRPEDDALKTLGQINWAMFVEEGFRGDRDDYYDPRNSYLNEVIDRKTGIPITLCILYRSVAGRLGLELDGVSLPGHFMLKFEDPERLVFIDPFNGDFIDRGGCERRLSEIVGRPIVLTGDLVAPCPDRLVVARMLRNLKAIHAQSGDLPALLPVQARLASILDDEPDEQRDLGVLCLQLGRPDDAVSALQEYLSRRGDAEDAPSIRLLLRDTQREISLRN